ncbi:MAG: hypothetical protein JKY08_05130 [Flavobacteriaceae bacterium]|nr:hypothetical protein [Flavobacteriaceae bacterium]
MKPNLKGELEAKYYLIDFDASVKIGGKISSFIGSVDIQEQVASSNY